MALLIAASYGLQMFNTGESREVTLAASPLPSASVRSESSLGKADLNQANKRLKNGDIVFRAGDTWLKNVAEQFASDVTYTHVGVITVEGSNLKVVHASIEGESLAETLGNRVVEEPLADFLQKGNATHAAIYRLKESASEEQTSVATATTAATAAATTAATVAKAYAEQATPFDAGFDLATADRVYCTELIWRAYLEAGIDLSDQGLESFSFPFSGQYLTPDSLSDSENLQPVYHFNEIRAVQSNMPHFGYFSALVRSKQ